MVKFDNFKNKEKDNRKNSSYTVLSILMQAFAEAC